jgi:hypothetical protein
VSLYESGIATLVFHAANSHIQSISETRISEKTLGLFSPDATQILEKTTELQRTQQGFIKILITKVI